MATNFIETGERLDWTATVAVTSGDPVLIGAMVGVALGTAAVDEIVVVMFKGVFVLPKTAPQVQAIGAKVYWDATAESFTTTASGNTFAGYVWKAALSADTTVQIVLAQ